MLAQALTRVLSQLFRLHLNLPSQPRACIAAGSELLRCRQLTIGFAPSSPQPRLLSVLNLDTRKKSDFCPPPVGIRNFS